MKGRLIAVVLVLVTLLSLTAVRTNAAASKEQELKEKIVKIEKGECYGII